MIAVGRHIIELDYHHANWRFLVGLGGLIFALAVGYSLVKKTIGSEATTPAEHSN